MKQPFESYRKNIYSQNGEDGVIQEILARLGLVCSQSIESARWCVEFGAWDGKHLSNTFALVEQKKWNSIYIEGDKQRFEDLKKTASQYPSIRPVCAFVDYVPKSINSLDNLLNVQNIPVDFDILSIDIDSYDLAVWHSINQYSPKIVIIEINSGYMPGVFFWHSNKVQGNSFSSTLKVAYDKGYNLVCHTGNMIFVRSDLVESLGIEPIFLENPELLFDFSYILPHFLWGTRDYPSRAVRKMKAMSKKIMNLELFQRIIRRG